MYRYAVHAGPVGWKVFDTVTRLCVPLCSGIPQDWRDYVVPTRRMAQKLVDQMNQLPEGTA
jgi:hypothetical protein